MIKLFPLCEVDDFFLFRLPFRFTALLFFCCPSQYAIKGTSLFRYVSSWIDTREVQSEKANLQILFDKYVPICLDTLRVRFKKITPVPDITMVTTLCYLLECLLNPTNTPPDCNKELYELYFVFAAVWAFGGAMFQDQVCTRRHS